MYKADEIYRKLAKKFSVTYDVTGSIGKRYRRQDEIGTPYCITVDFDTLEDGCVTVRDRDSMQQVRIKTEELENYTAAWQEIRKQHKTRNNSTCGAGRAKRPASYRRRFKEYLFICDRMRLRYV